MKNLRVFFAGAFALCCFSGFSAKPDSMNIKHIQKITSSTGGLGNIISAGDNFGGRITCLGDLDGDGVPDLAVSDPFDNTSSTWGGAFYILFMNTDGTVKSSNKIYSNHSGMNSLPSGCRFGSAVASLGDIDGDGIPDIAVTALATNNYEGAVYILNMTRSGNVKSSALIDGNTTGFTGVLNSGDIMGFDVACPGDVNGDGVNDILIGAHGSDNNMGAAYILFLNNNSTLKGYKKIDDNALGSGILNNGDFFGEALGAIGDQDGDGVPDVGIGAIGTNSGTGAVYEIHLNKDGSVKNFIKIDGTQKTLFKAIPKGGGFGSAVVLLPDIDRTGNRGLLIGSESDSIGGPLTGASYILHMDSSHNVESYNKIDNNTIGISKHLRDSGEFGSGATYLPSFNKDYKYAIAIGALADNQSGHESGAFYMIFMDTLVASGIDNNSAIVNNDINVYPNPFAGITNLSYRLTSDENVDIRLFDVSGKEVSVIASGTQNSGDYSYTINKNSKISSGVYFVRYIIGNEVATFKIINAE